MPTEKSTAADTPPKLPDATEAGKTLTDVLGQAEHVKELVEQSAQELSSVNTGLAREMEQAGEAPGMRLALEKSQAVEGKVQDAADKLSVVNLALEAEVSTRQALETQLETVTQEEEAARHAALHDPLTGLPNRTLFENRLEHGLAQAKRHDRTLAVMFLDLDGFKAINDVHGHDVGDAVLQAVAHRLKENARDDDTVSRFGGDEFLYLLTEIENDQDAIRVVEKICAAIQMPCQLSVGELVVRCSIGIAIFPKNGTTASALIKSADTAMYQAKRNKSVYAFAA
ncbi:MAG: GGDEF domain-containing protein [Pseudomonadota bacterium]